MEAVPYSKVWEFLRRYMNNPSLMPTRSQDVGSLLYNGDKSRRKVIKNLNRYCKKNGIKTKFENKPYMTLGELLDQAEPLNLNRMLSRRLRNLKRKKYVY